MTLPAVLTSSQSELQFLVRAAPATAGLIAGTLEVTSTDRLAPTRRVAISGVSAPPPRLQVTARHDFGEVHVVRGGAPGPRVTLTVENRGGSPLTFGPPALAVGSAASLSLQTAALPTLSPGGRGTLDVVFSPTTVGTSTGALVLTSNDPDRPMVTVALTVLPSLGMLTLAWLTLRRRTVWEPACSRLPSVGTEAAPDQGVCAASCTSVRPSTRPISSIQEATDSSKASL